MKYIIGERFTCIAQPIFLMNILQRMLGRLGSMDVDVLSVKMFLGAEDELQTTHTTIRGAVTAFFLQITEQSVLMLHAPSNGGPISRVWTGWSCGPAEWLSLLLIKASDIETNRH